MMTNEEIQNLYFQVKSLKQKQKVFVVHLTLE